MPDDLLPDDLRARRRLSSYKSSSSSPSSEQPITCDIEEISKGKIVPYIGAPITPTTEAGLLAQHLAVMNTILAKNNDLLQQISNYLTTKSPSDSWFEIQTTSTVPTPPDAVNPNQDPNNLTDGIIPGYDQVEVNKQLHGRNAQILWLVNDGLVPTGSNTGRDIFVITSTDGLTFSPEFRVAFGEVRIINDVYEFRFRCAVPGNFIRASEREIIPPYIQSILVSGGGSTIANRSAFTANRVNAWSSMLLPPNDGISLTGGIPPIPPNPNPSVPIPNGFAVTVRAFVDNPGTSRLYVANSIANTGSAPNRVTLAPGDSVSLYVTDANLIFLRGENPVGTNPGPNIVFADWIVES